MLSLNWIMFLFFVSIVANGFYFCCLFNSKKVWQCFLGAYLMAIPVILIAWLSLTTTLDLEVEGVETLNIISAWSFPFDNQIPTDTPSMEKQCCYCYSEYGFQERINLTQLFGANVNGKYLDDVKVRRTTYKKNRYGILFNFPDKFELVFKDKVSSSRMKYTND